MELNYENTPLVKSLLLNEDVKKTIQDNEGTIVLEVKQYLINLVREVRGYVKENIGDFTGEDFQETFENIQNYTKWKVCDELEYTDIINEE